MTPRFTLPDRLAKARTFAGHTQAELAHLLGVSLSTERRLEHGTVSPNRMDLIGWAVICGVDAAWLLGEQPTPMLTVVGTRGPPVVLRRHQSRGLHPRPMTPGWHPSMLPPDTQ